MNKSADHLRSGIAAVFIWAVSALPALAAEARCTAWTARAASIQGKVDVQPDGQPHWQTVRDGDTFCRGDVIRVGRNSRAALELFNDTILRLAENSTVLLPEPEPDGGFWVELFNGVLHLVSRVSSRLEIRSPTTTAGLEGTEFVFAVNDAVTTLDVIEGQVAFSNARGVVRVSTGHSARSEIGAPPVLTLAVATEQSVRWAMHYPLLDGTDDQSRSPWLAMAQRELRLGQVDRAQRALAQAPDDSTAQSEAQALRALIAIVQNRRGQAMQHGLAARRLNPHSPSALLALSYAQQANHDLAAASHSAELAVQLNPKNGLLWARHAEMLLATDAPADAARAARTAVELAPHLARTHMLVGYTALAEGDAAGALTAFDHAVTLDSADPMARLGRGLTLIRIGKLADGRREMEIALSLAPADAVVRSYLGKAYDAENRFELAETQYALAKTLDPQDPTAYFYEAMLRHVTNRPVGALQSLKAAMARNDNRLVYRSGLAADQDRAARNAALARIYSTLGLEQQADEAIADALLFAPGDYAAHRFRADTLNKDDRQSLARASEVLQSQLLQPLNLYPVPPALAQSNLDILRDAGPQTVGVNEFNPLFVRDQTVFQLSTVVGSDDAFGDEAMAGLLQGNWAVQAGQFHFETEGFRPNADINEDIFTLFAQHRLTSATSVQAEVRRHDQTRGDIGLHFDPASYSNNKREQQRVDSARIGVRHDLNGRSQLLGSVIYVEKTKNTSDRAPVPSTPFTATSDQRSDDHGYLAEAQYLLRLDGARFVAGGGYYANAVDDVLNVQVTLGPTVVSDQSFVTDVDETHANGYLYGYFPMARRFHLVTGLSYDNLDSAPIQRAQLNPKLGALWDMGNTRVRLAAFRTLQRSLLSDQTLEPTQVAGFTQFWDDPLGTDAKAVAAAIQQDLGKHLTVGARGLYRRLDVPVQDATAMLTEERHVDRRAQAYLTWLYSARTVASVGYHYEARQKKDSASVVANEPLSLTTHKVPISLSYHHPSGWYGRLTQTYHNQKGRIKTSTLLPAETQADSFWLTDIEAGFRLPRRQGLVSLRVSNLFDQSFNFRDTDFATGTVQAPQIQPSRSVSLNLVIPFH